MGDEKDTIVDLATNETVLAPERSEPHLPGVIEEEGPLLAGRYRILGMIGAGAMGTVYRARDVELDEIVALKVLHAHLTNAAGVVDRFRQEVKLARKVTHGNVARVFDIGEHGAEKFLTMELVEGESLADVLGRAGPPSLARTVEVVRAIALALDAAHRAHIVHRDLKPENVLVARDGRVVVTDFGIARALAEGAAHTTSPQGFVGTPAYMAPEQVEGRVELDARADVYALGEIAYELLTGEPAWPGNEALAVAFARLTRPPPDPTEARPGLPPVFGALVQKAMARDRDARFANALELADGLERAVASLSIVPPAKPPSLRPSIDVAEITVAVLPFRHDDDPESKYVAEGLTSELVDGLSMTPRLRVRPHGAAVRFADHGDAAVAGRELGVMAVVTGVLRRTPASLRLSARVISVSQGFQLWARHFECQTRDLLTVTDEVAHAVAAALSSIVPAPARRPVEDGEAIELYLRARAVMREGWHVWRLFAPALDLMDRALARAPNDPSVRAGWAIARARGAFLRPGTTETVSELAVARKAAAEVVAASPHLVEAWLALGTVCWTGQDMVGVIRAVRGALDASSQLVRAHDLLARVLLELGELEPAIARFEHLYTLDPDPLAVDQWWDLARAYALSARWDEFDELVARRGDDPKYRVVTSMFRARYAVWRGLRDPGWVIPNALDFDTNPGAIVRLFGTIVREGRIDQASLETVARVRIAGKTLYLFFQQVRIEAFLAVGETGAALEALTRIIDDGFLDLGWMDHMPLLAPLRTSARWPALRERVASQGAPALLEARALGLL